MRAPSDTPALRRARRPLAPWAAALAFLAASPALAAEVAMSGGFPVTSSDRIYRLSEVKRGDRGVGYTVFAGAEAQPFEVEVLGVLEGMLGPGQDVILARLHGELIEHTGVISGMSGSPVYIDGRLVGAVGYRFGFFSKEPIAGITPIESMLEVKDGGAIEPNRALSRAGAGRGANARSGLSVAQVRSRDALPAVTLPRTQPLVGTYDPVPIETPIVMSGLDPRSAERLRTTLEAAGFVAGAGGGSAPAEQTIFAPRASDARKVSANAASSAGRVDAAPIAPAAPIAALLMRGDVRVAAIGTVTFVEGDRVLAFGHPFLGYGHVRFPMATAAILHTLASGAGSYKQGAPALEVGAISHDRLTAIGGTLGQVAPMVPVRIRVSRAGAPASERAEETRVEIVDDPIWLPVMLETIVQSAALRRLGHEAGGTVELHARLHVGDRTLAVVDTYAAPAPTPVGAIAANDLANVMAIIARNSLRPASVRGVEIELKLKSEVALSFVEQALPDRAVVRPGDRLGITVILRPYLADPVRARIEVQIPRDAAEGPLDVVVGGGIELDRKDGEIIGEQFPRDLDELLGILAERREARALHARVYTHRPGWAGDVELYSGLPPSLRATLSGLKDKSLRATKDAPGPESSVPYPDVVVGSRTLEIVVRP